MPPISHENAATDPATRSLLSLNALESGGGDFSAALEVADDAEARALAPYFATVDLISIRIPSLSDGRGFALARRLRALGYQGRLQAKGEGVAGLLSAARASGFDEVEVAPTLHSARFQPALRPAANANAA